MTQLLRRAAKALPHPLLLRLFHERFLRQEAFIAGEMARITQLPSFDVLDFAPLKASDTLFILGSGSSINQITERQWNVIKRHDTVGFNFWPLHSFIPRVYFFESIAAARQRSVFDALLKLLNLRATAYADTVKIITEIKKPTTPQLVTELTGDIRKNLYLGYTIPVVARDEQEVERGLRFLDSKGYFEPSDQITRLFKYGGSVTGMMSFALKMGYRRIVLCGIDLGDQKYFYQDPDLYPDSSDWEFAPRANVHLTARRLPWLVPAQEVVYAFKRTILDPRNIELFVQNPSSSLYPVVPSVPEGFYD